MKLEDQLGGRIRFEDLPLSELEFARSAIDDMYDDRLDLVLIRNALDSNVIATCEQSLDQQELPWLEPNEGIPGIGIKLLGTPASPTGKTPQGPSEEAYLEADSVYRGIIERLFGDSINLEKVIEELLGGLAKGRPVSRPELSDGSPRSPCNVRMLPNGESIIPHVDYHYGLPIYDQLARQLDVTTLISFFLVLKKPNEGGDLILYDLTNDSDKVPRLANGYCDMAAIEANFSKTHFAPQEGDLIVFPAGRCFHKVDRVVGDRPRVTIGGFAALDKARENLLYWG